MSTHKTMSLICCFSIKNRREDGDGKLVLDDTSHDDNFDGAGMRQTKSSLWHTSQQKRLRARVEGKWIKFRSVFPSTEVFPPWNHVSWQTDASRNVGANFHVNKQQFFIVSKKVAVMQRYLGQCLLLFGWKIYCGGKIEKCLYCVTGWRRTPRVWVMFRKYFLSGSFIFYLALKEFLCGVCPPTTLAHRATDKWGMK